MAEKVLWEQLALYGEYDVVVVGGGTAGFAAAAAAAKNGSKTLVVEQRGFLGGMLTGGNIGVIHGFLENETNEKHIGGILGDMVDRLVAYGASKGIEEIFAAGRPWDRYMTVSYDDNVLKVIIDEIVTEAGAEILFDTKMTGVRVENGKIAEIAVFNEKGLQKIRSKVFIDATFSGILSAEAGVTWELGDETGYIQPASLMFTMANVDVEKWLTLTYDEKHAIALQGIEDGILKVDWLLARPIEGAPGKVFCNMSRHKVNNLEPTELAAAEVALRKQNLEIGKLFADKVPGFENAYLSGFASCIGLRDSRRIIGKHKLSIEDVVECTEFEDTIASSSYTVDIHKDNTNVLYEKKKRDYHVPFRCLVNNEIANLATAGRCISADAYGHAALRSMGTCVRIGEAAGLAASLSVQQGCEINEFNGNVLKDMLQQWN